MTCTYKLTALGERGCVVTVKRRYRVQTGGRLAALLLANAEMQRLWNETGGNPEKVLAPIRTALLEKGFTDVVILPSSTELVELTVDSKPPFVREDPEGSNETFYANELRTLMHLVSAYFNAATKKAQGELLQSKLAELETLTWAK
jgi:hypothetical protein